MRTRLFICLLIRLTAWEANAQLYIGFSGEIGNSLSINPNPSTLLKGPIMPSGSLIIAKHEEINEGWSLQYGISAGILGYTLHARQIDTLNNDPSFYDRYPNYTTLSLSGHLSIGKTFRIDNKKASVMVGGGATRFLDLLESPTIGGTSTWNGSTFERVFEYNIGLNEHKVKGFIQVSFLLFPKERFILGLYTRKYFSNVMTGKYQFYHTRNEYSGNLTLTPASIGLIFMIKIGRVNGSGFSIQNPH